MRHSLLNHKAYKIVGYELIIGIIIILILPCHILRKYK